MPATPAVFIDRDGTLSEEVGYVNHPKRLRSSPVRPAELTGIRDDTSSHTHDSSERRPVPCFRHRPCGPSAAAFADQSTPTRPRHVAAGATSLTRPPGAHQSPAACPRGRVAATTPYPEPPGAHQSPGTCHQDPHGVARLRQRKIQFWHVGVDGEVKEIPIGRILLWKTREPSSRHSPQSECTEVTSRRRAGRLCFHFAGLGYSPRCYMLR